MMDLFSHRKDFFADEKYFPGLRGIGQRSIIKWSNALLRNKQTSTEALAAIHDTQHCWYYCDWSWCQRQKNTASDWNSSLIDICFSNLESKTCCVNKHLRHHPSVDEGNSKNRFTYQSTKDFGSNLVRDLELECEYANRDSCDIFIIQKKV